MMSMSSPSSRAARYRTNSRDISSATRKALNERSNSETNIPPSPTIRIVNEPDDTTVYARSPFPSHPSQVLPPHQKPGYAFEDRGSDLARVSDENITTQQHSKSLVPSPLQPKKPNRHSHSTVGSSIDSRHDRRSFSGTASTFTPDHSRLSQATYSTPPSSPGLSEDEELPTVLHVVREEPSFSTIRTVIPSSPPEAGPLTYKASEASLASTASGGTVAIRRIEDPQGSSQSLSTPSTFQKTPKNTDSARYGSPQFSSSPNWYATNSSSTKSLDSIVHSDGSQQSLQRSISDASTPHSALLYPVYEGDVQVQYPIVRSPSSSSSWAESSSPTPLPIDPPQQTSPTMTDRGSRPPQWSPRLSVIASESGRSSFSLSQPESSSPRPMWSPSPKRQRRFSSSASGSSAGESSQISSSGLQAPAPLFHPGPTRVYRLPPENVDLDEQEDVLHELQSPPLRHKRSGYQNRYTWDSRPSSSRPSTSRPGSTQSEAASERSAVSFSFAQTFPSWARRYYSFGDRANHIFFSSSQLSLNRPASRSLRSRLGSSYSNRSFNQRDGEYGYPDRLDTPYSLSSGPTSGPSGSPTSATFPYSFSIFHPRKRPRYLPKKSSKRKGKAPAQLTLTPQVVRSPEPTGESLADSDMYVRGPPMRHVSESFVPRLGKDRRSVYQSNRWTAPSFDEAMSPVMSPVNRQLTLFCFGFLVPLAWMVASVLPLPEKPLITLAAMQEINNQVDSEQAVSLAIDPMEWKRYNKARWWRNLNRIMSAIGLLLVGAVISLAIISTRFKG